ncbi:acid phosphatase [Xanthomonas vasicola]|nr:acid phosphatase [Xanthomonas vasicola]KGR51268.1 acid phosphatase [Xanthomonas vasicola]KGR51557.1 acid phosphatase [Xanthomonas vasicola]KGT81998.1 acid phosphatase [Xanthomonas vasicola]
MQRKPQIEAGLGAEIDHLLEQSAQIFRRGTLAESLALGL